MPLDVSTVRAARRWVYVRRHHTEVDRHVLVVVACLCVALFAVSFAVGRVTRPAGRPGEQQPRSVQLGSNGVAVPASLGSAPAVALKPVTPVSVPPRRRAAAAPLTTSTVSEPITPVAIPPAIPSSSAPAASAPSVQAAPLRTAPRAPVPSVGKSTSGGSRGGQRPAGATSFDTSG